MDRIIAGLFYINPREEAWKLLVESLMDLPLDLCQPSDLHAGRMTMARYLHILIIGNLASALMQNYRGLGQA